MVDDPMHQRQVPLCHDFWKQGNLLVYGMTLSGKTTFLKSLLISMCCTYSPAQVQFYLMEFTGFGLRSLETFPHGSNGDTTPGPLPTGSDGVMGALPSPAPCSRCSNARADSYRSYNYVIEFLCRLPRFIN